jgi:hypothetical protein
MGFWSITLKLTGVGAVGAMAYLIYYLVAGSRKSASPVTRVDFVETCRCSTARFSHCHLAKSSADQASHDSITTMVDIAEWDEFLTTYALDSVVEVELATLAKWPAFKATKGLHIHWGCCESAAPGLANSIVLGVIDELAVVHFPPEVGKSWTRQASLVKMNHCPLALPGAVGLPIVVPRTSSKRWANHWTAWLGDVIDRERAICIGPDAVMSFAAPGWLEARVATVGAALSVSQHTYTNLPRLERSKYEPKGVAPFVPSKRQIVHELDGVACKRVCNLATSRFGDPLLECILPGQSPFELVLGKDGHPAFNVGSFFYRSVHPDVTLKPLKVICSALVREQQHLVFRGVVTEELTASLPKSVTETDLAHDVQTLVADFKCPSTALTWLCLRHMQVGWKSSDDVGHWVCECHATENAPMILVLWGPEDNLDLTYGVWFGAKKFAAGTVEECLPHEPVGEADPQAPIEDQGDPTWFDIGKRSLATCLVSVVFMILSSGVPESQIEGLMQTALTKFVADLPSVDNLVDQVLEPDSLVKLAALCEANVFVFRGEPMVQLKTIEKTNYSRNWFIRIDDVIRCKLHPGLGPAVESGHMNAAMESMSIWIEVLACGERVKPANNLGTWPSLCRLSMPRTSIQFAELINEWQIRQSDSMLIDKVVAPSHLTGVQAATLIRTVFTWSTRSAKTRLVVAANVGVPEFCRQLAFIKALVAVDPSAVVPLLDMSELDEMASVLQADTDVPKQDVACRLDLEFAECFSVPEVPSKPDE